MLKILISFLIMLWFLVPGQIAKAEDSCTIVIDGETGEYICGDNVECRLDSGTIGICQGCTCVPIN